MSAKLKRTWKQLSGPHDLIQKWAIVEGEKVIQTISTEDGRLFDAVGEVNKSGMSYGDVEDLRDRVMGYDA